MLKYLKNPNLNNSFGLDVKNISQKTGFDKEMVGCNISNYGTSVCDRSKCSFFKKCKTLYSELRKENFTINE